MSYQVSYMCLMYKVQSHYNFSSVWDAGLTLFKPFKFNILYKTYVLLQYLES